MNENQIKRYVGIFPLTEATASAIATLSRMGRSALETQIEQSIGKLELVPGDYVAISQVGLIPKTKTLTNFTVRVTAAPLEVVL